ncbi:DUF1192 domain-containing protein [Sphingomonas sp. CJ99]
MDDPPRARAGDLIPLLSQQDLDPLSLAELDARIVALQREIERVQAHRQRAASHRASADALFNR